MRRPLKPFVTEYKTANRRQAASVGDTPQPETERSAPKLFDMRAKPPTDDSYEAAMRAADALFASPASRREAPVSAPMPVDEDATDAAPSAASIFAKSPAPKAPVAEPAADAPGNAQRAAEGASSTSGAPPRGGRILRVIDEPPSPEYAALEAAHTPKRRGRKPGSKNKPKVAALLAEPQAPVAAFYPDDAQDDADTYEVDDALVTEAAPSSPAGAAVAVRRVVALATAPASRGDKRFPWVRDRLKPGEEWKRRRLPRICW